MPRRIAFDIAMPSAGYYFVMPHDKVATPAIGAFRDWLIETAKPRPIPSNMA